MMNALVGEHEGERMKSINEGLILLRCDSILRAPCNDKGGGGGGGGISWTWLDNIMDALWD